MVDPTVQVDGICPTEFEAVCSAFIKNFTQRGEVGAAVAIYVEGEPVVDLWGGAWFATVYGAGLGSATPWSACSR